MQSNIENLGALERRLVISVSKDKIQEELGTRLKRLAKNAKIHGFRPGKVPLKIVAQQYGPQLKQEILSDALHKNFNEAVQTQNIRVAGYPRFEDKPVDESDVQYEFSVLFEVYPEIALGDLSQVNIEKPIVEVGADDVDKTLDILRKQHTKYEPVEREVMSGDRVNIDYRGMIDDTDFEGGTAKGALLIVGEGKLLKQFEESLVGMRLGQNKTFEVVFPEDYHGKEIAGKTVTFEVTLNKIEVPALPEIDNEFAKLLGIADGDTQKMHSEIQLNLEREVEKRTKAKLKDQIMQSLLDTTKIDAPNVLIDQEKKRLMEEARQNFENRGMKFDEAMINPELFQSKAEYRIKLGLILSELVKTHDLKAQPEQIRKVVEESAQGYENPEEVIKWHYSSPENLKEVEAVVLEDNVVTWALQQVKVVDKATTFDQLMEIA
ncbi:MAG: trigger factor [Nitrosomonas sp.]|jgi:trigger factor|nr:MAG: trigger factor [Nitrosomonas sp.]